ncbi:MAG: hypothetical protein OEM46_08885 [Ignavibacteria bacterium]|nr:hypothetical protein [Ignavibacteria bacterium]
MLKMLYPACPANPELSGEDGLSLPAGIDLSMKAGYGRIFYVVKIEMSYWNSNKKAAQKSGLIVRLLNVNSKNLSDKF